MRSWLRSRMRTWVDAVQMYLFLQRPALSLLRRFMFLIERKDSSSELEFRLLQSFSSLRLFTTVGHASCFALPKVMKVDSGS